MIKAYLLSPTRMRLRGENDQAFKDLLKIWTEQGGDVSVARAGAMDLLGDIPSFWALAERISADSRLFPVSEMMMTRLESVEVKTGKSHAKGRCAFDIRQATYHGNNQCHA